jgi:hypothetical protein
LRCESNLIILHVAKVVPVGDDSVLNPRMLETSLKKGEDKQEKAGHGALVAKGELFSIFPKAGLAFGGALGKLAVLI